MRNSSSPFSLAKFYWLMLIPLFLFISYYELFINWQVQRYSFHELEDFGRYVFVSFIAFVEALIIIYILAMLERVLKKYAWNNN